VGHASEARRHRAATPPQHGRVTDAKIYELHRAEVDRLFAELWTGIPAEDAVRAHLAALRDVTGVAGDIMMIENVR
jgi:hypothetical protein